MNASTLTINESPWALRPLLSNLSRLDRGRLTLSHRGHHYQLSGLGDEQAELRVKRPVRLLGRLLGRGDIGFAEGYMAGDWDSPDLTALLRLMGHNEHRFASLQSPSQLAQFGQRLLHWGRRNSRRGSRRNIAYHYDLGNDFYRLWLDSGMGYSAALFEYPEQSLEQAQQHKYERLLDQLGARPGQRLLEIGCGWGGLAETAARRGLSVDAITLSREQLKWTRQRIARAGLGDRVQARLCDYRDLRGQYDHIVSIEMFEAVGEAYWANFMQTLSRVLRPGGRAALQVITIDDAYFERYRSQPDFIQRYIFPGGMLPTPDRLQAEAEAAGLSLVNQLRFGPHYAQTLRLWRARFDQARDWIEALDFDQRFLRMWHYYLCYCEAGFDLGRIDVEQVVLGHNGRG